MAGAAVADPPVKVGEKGLESVKESAGPAVGDMPPRAPDDSVPDPEPRGKITAEGTVEVGKLKAGGKSPTHGTLQFKGLKQITLPDKMGYEKGNVIYITGLATVTAAGEVDKRDGTTKQVVDCAQAHVATIDDFRVVNEPLVRISAVQKALTEIAELAAAGDLADMDSAIIDKLEELAA